MIVLQKQLVPGSTLRQFISTRGVIHHHRDLHSQVEFLCSNFFLAGIKFLPEILYQDFAFWQDSHQNPGGEFFSWWDLGEDRFLGGILAEMSSRSFTQEDFLQENWPLQQDPDSWQVPGILAGSWWDGSQEPILQWQKSNLSHSNRNRSQIFKLHFLQCCCCFCTAKLPVTKCSFELDLMKKKNSIEGVASHLSF